MYPHKGNFNGNTLNNEPTLWANMPTPSSVPNQFRYCTDISQLGGVLMVSNGSVWKSAGGGPIQLAQSAVAIGIPPSMTVGNNGAISAFATAFPRTISEGCYLYFSSNQLYAGSAAGFYWTIMSSTTVGTVYADMYTPGTIINPPVTPTPIVATGPGAITGTTIAITVVKCLLRGNLLGLNGKHTFEWLYSQSPDANIKFWDVRLDSSPLGASNSATTSNGFGSISSFCNVNSLTRQKANGYGSDYSSSGTAQANSPPCSTTIDTSVDRYVSIVLAHSNSSSWCILERFESRVTPG